MARLIDALARMAAQSIDCLSPHRVTCCLAGRTRRGGRQILRQRDLCACENSSRSYCQHCLPAPRDLPRPLGRLFTVGGCCNYFTNCRKDQVPRCRRGPRKWNCVGCPGRVSNETPHVASCHGPTMAAANPRPTNDNCGPTCGAAATERPAAKTGVQVQRPSAERNTCAIACAPSGCTFF